MTFTHCYCGALLRPSQPALCDACTVKLWRDGENARAEEEAIERDVVRQRATHVWVGYRYGRTS